MSDIAKGAGGQPEENQDLAAMHRRLVAIVAELDAAVDAAPDAAAVRRLTAQISAANARVTLVGRQLFASRTGALSEAAREVADAIPRAERALRDVERLDEALASVTAVLHLVDKAVDLAKAAG